MALIWVQLTVRLGVPQDLEDLCVDRVLPQCPHDVPTLAVADLPIARPVKQQEGLLELCTGHTHRQRKSRA